MPIPLAVLYGADASVSAKENEMQQVLTLWFNQTVFILC